MRTMIFRGSAALGVIAIAMVSGGRADAATQTETASAQATVASDARKKTDDATASADTRSDQIIVVGVRRSIEEAADKKRKARNVVDAIVAEDAGKLPDNNVPEAIARIPGVNISRSQGQGGEVTIRGLAGVQTTVNGNDVAVGDGRSLSLSDIPAELIKSVEVYKSRDASQAEGGIGGTVNIELRRPLDLKKGLTGAGSIRGLYDDRTRATTPYASALLGGHFDSGIGEWGFLLNGSYTETKWREGFVTNESPDQLFGAAQAALPAAIRATAVAPYRIQYGLDSGRRTQPALTGTLQWKPSDHLNFVLEGQYFGSTYRSKFNALDLQTREDYPIPSNVVLLPSGAIRSFTLTRLPPAADPDNPDAPVVIDPQRGLPVGNIANQTRGKNQTYIANFEAHWNAENVRIDFSQQYQRGRNKSFAVDTYGRYLNATQAVVDFASPNVPGGGPQFDIVGVDENDPAQLVFGSFTDRLDSFKSDLHISQFDVTIDVSPEKFFRTVKFGTRLSLRKDVSNYGYRYVAWQEGRRPAADALPGVDTVTINPRFRGMSNLSWASFDSDDIYENWNSLRPQIIALDPDDRAGPNADLGLTEFFSPDRPSTDRGQVGKFNENIFAAYGQVDYGFKIGFPVDGFAGVRYVNTWGGNTSTRYNTLPLVDENGIPLRESDGSFQCCRSEQVYESTRANFVDILPSAALNWHFDSKTQLRTTYNYNVQRPSFYALRNFIDINQTNPGAPVYAGNPDLKPTRDHNFNFVLEWYPRNGTSVSLGAFYKKQKGFIYYTQQLESLPQLGGQQRLVFRERNAGPGEVQGFEFSTSTNFFFLPGILNRFGASVNATFIPTAKISVPDITATEFVNVKSPFTSKYSTNLVLFYDSKSFSTRLAYNWRSPYKTGFDAVNPDWVQQSYPTQRLDAAVNYTPIAFMTLSLEATNILHNNDRFRYDLYRDLPVGLRQMSRTLQASARFRF